MTQATTTSPATRRIGPFEVHPIGLGCMNLSHAYGVPPSPEQGERVLLAALDAGVTLFDTAALYGFGRNEELVGRVLAPHRDRITLASKGGMAGVDGKRVIDGRPEAIRANAEDSLRRLGTDVIDLYYLHRWDKSVPIEDSVGVMAELVKEGKVRRLGLSEVSADTLRRAHAVHPIDALQNEFSLWTRNAELGTLAACAELGTAYVAFSPLGRGALTGVVRDPASFADKDIRRAMPRFDADHFPANLTMIDAFVALADEAGCTAAQLALAWVLAQGEHVVAIPGTTDADHLRDDVAAASLDLPASVLARAGDIVNERTVSGPRYNAATAAEIDTEAFPEAG